MSTSRHHDSGPAGVFAAIYSTPHKPIWAPTDVAERRPLLSQARRESKSGDRCFTSLVILCTIFILCLLPLIYFYSTSTNAVDYKSLYQGAQTHIRRLSASNLALKNEVTLYQDLYDDVRTRAEHLEQENAALEDETHRLETEVHSLRGKLMNSKALAFWEIARIMDTNMDVWVSADDWGVGPKFWSYGITNGRYNDNNPPVTSTTLRFTADQAAIIESTEQHRIVGYKVESNRFNNGWWIATGLNEFGQGGAGQVKFSAKAANNGAEYEVVVFYADWKF